MEIIHVHKISRLHTVSLGTYLVSNRIMLIFDISRIASSHYSLESTGVHIGGIFATCPSSKGFPGAIL